MPKTPKLTAAPSTNNFQGTLPGTISKDEIYHRVEWFFDMSHNPHGPHSIPPTTPLNLLMRNLGLSDLYVAMTRASQIYMPAWASPLFHGVAIPWISAPGIVGMQDCKTFQDLVDCLVQSYKHAGWRVI